MHPGEWLSRRGERRHLLLHSKRGARQREPSRQARTFSSSLVVIPKRCRRFSFLSSSSDECCGVVSGGRWGWRRRGCQMLAAATGALQTQLPTTASRDLAATPSIHRKQHAAAPTTTHQPEPLRALFLLVILRPPKLLAAQPLALLRAQHRDRLDGAGGGRGGGGLRGGCCCVGLR